MHIQADEQAVIQPTEIHTHTVIFLNPYGSTARECADELSRARYSSSSQHGEYDEGNGKTLPQIFPTYKWIFPPSQGRQAGSPGWHFRILADTKGQHEGLKRSLRRSLLAIVNIIHAEAEKVGAKRIWLGGIHRGCAVALYALLHLEMEIGGFIGLGGWFPLRTKIDFLTTHPTAPESYKQQAISFARFLLQKPPRIATRSNCQVLNSPIFLAHMRSDNLVALRQGKDLRNSLELMGVYPEWYEYYHGEHWRSKGVSDIVVFMKGCSART